MDTMYDTLLQLPLFQGICKNDFTDILGKVKLRFSRHKEGEMILKKGDSCAELVFLLKGEVAAESTDNKHLFSFWEHLEAPQVLEPYSLFGMDTYYLSSYVAKTEVNLVSIHKMFVLAELNKYEIFRLNYLNIISKHSQILYDHIWNKLPQNTEEKIIYFLVSHSEKSSGKKLLKIKMEDFALLLGDTRLTVSKALNELQNKALVVLRRKEVEIPNIQLLTDYLSK